MASDSVFESDIFTFEIGPEKKRFILHKKAVADRSPVLGALMNNGVMKESTAGLVQLEDIELPIFRLFAEYVYTGMYRVSSAPQKQQIASRLRKFEITCEDCGFAVVEGTLMDIPSKCPDCEGKYVDVKDIEDDTFVITNLERPARSRRSHNSVSPDSSHNSSNASDTVKDPLSKMSFPALGKPHEDLQQHLKTLHPPDTMTNNISYHAKLFILAQMYMVEPLAELCLHKLHRDLSALEVDIDNISEVVELISYTYDNTTTAIATGTAKLTRILADDDEEEEEDDEGDLGAKLRALVMAYAAVNAELLFKFTAYQTMLEKGGRLVVDLFAGAFCTERG